MIPLLTSQEVKALDALAERRFGLSVDLLMEHAGRSVAEVAARWCASGRAVVFTGPGNNGGDGVVAARHLIAAGLRVEVALVVPESDLSPVCQQNLARFRAAGGHTSTALPALGLGDLALDALLGTGLSRAPDGPLAAAIEHLNAARALGCRVVAVDQPSGVNADTGTALGACVQADATVTFAAYKRGLAQEPGATYAGAISLGSLGLPPAALVAIAPRAGLLELGDVRGLFAARTAAGFKNDFGHLLVLAGSPGKSGAAALVLRGALRSGAGLVTLAAPASVLALALVGQPEAMSIALAGEAPLGPAELAPLQQALSGKRALAIGPGLWRGPATGAVIGELLASYEGATVLDADALNAIAGKPGLLAAARGPTVVTPHPGEMGRLLGKSIADVQANRFSAAADFACTERTVVVLKGAKTVVASPEGELAVVPTGNPGLAHGGTGDVLCGLIGGLLAQGLPAFAAACAGAYLHGLSGDRLTASLGQRGLTAGEVADHLGALWAELGL